MAQIKDVIPTKYGMKDGGAFFTCNMRKSADGGVMAGYSISDVGHRAASTSTARLATMKKFVQREYTGGQTITSIWGLNSYSDGGLWVNLYYGNEIKQAIDLGATPGDDWNTTNEDVGASSSLEVCNDNEIVYSGRKYIGKTATSTLDGAILIDATTIDVIDATDFPSAGQATIISGFYSECIEYSGKTANQLTGVTRNMYYSTARAWSDKSEIVSFINHWQTWTTGLGSTTKSVSVKWEDYIFISRGYTVAGWKADDGSDLNEAMLTIPSNYEIVDMTTILTGSGTKVLIAANRENSGDIFVWNGVDTDWERIIECNENIKKLDKNFVALLSGLYQTDTYSLTLIDELPDDKNNINNSNFDVTDMKIRKNDILCLSNGEISKGQRNRAGLWIYSLKDRDWTFAPVYGGNFYNVTLGALFISSEWKILLSTNYKEGSVNRLSSNIGSKSSYYQILYTPKTAHTLKLQELKLNLQMDVVDYWQEVDDASSLDIDVIVRVYNFSRPFYQFSEIKSQAADASHINIYKTYGMPRVGDRIEIASNIVNNDVASCPRSITAITIGDDYYGLTLDAALPETVLSNNQFVILNPLTFIKKISLTDYKIDPKTLKILVPGQPEFQKLIIEVEFRDRGNKTYTPNPQLNNIELRASVLT